MEGKVIIKVGPFKSVCKNLILVRFVTILKENLVPVKLKSPLNFCRKWW